MARQPPHSPLKARKGTATTHSGKATAARILDVARELLMAEGAGELSMRNLANRAGLHLNNVQYYFPKRDDLVQALIVDTGERYQRAYDEMLNGATDDPLERFQAILRFNLNDSFNPQTRQLFLQLWALLSTLDPKTGRLLGKLYDINISQLGASLARIHPHESDAEIRHRATLVAALTEGLMVVHGRTESKAKDRRLIEYAYAMAMDVAVRRSLDSLDGADLTARLAG
jgi:AcrR family transcriptional regulator